MAMNLDAATIAAVKQTKKEKEAAASHRRQLSRNTARKRANLQVIKARKEATVEAANARAAAAGTIQANKTQATREAITARSNAATGQRSQVRREQLTSKVESKVAGKVISTATPSSDSNLFMVVVFTIVGLALFYQLVTRADQFSGFLGSAGDFLHKLSSTTPLFQVVPNVQITKGTGGGAGGSF
jgi:hypothetical protein